LPVAKLLHVAGKKRQQSETATNLMRPPLSQTLEVLPAVNASAGKGPLRFTSPCAPSPCGDLRRVCFARDLPLRSAPYPLGRLRTGRFAHRPDVPVRLHLCLRHSCRHRRAGRPGHAAPSATLQGCCARPRRPSGVGGGAHPSGTMSRGEGTGVRGEV